MNAIVSPSLPAERLGLRFSELYDRLKYMAKRQRCRLPSDDALCTTELVHEVFMRMEAASYQDGQAAQFFAYAARAMRHVLTDAARQRMQQKRGGDLVRLTLEDEAVSKLVVNFDISLQLDIALTALEEEDARAAKVVEMHFFAGVDLHSIADMLGVARRTIDRDWKYARAFLANFALD